jgi:hypothetical protein
MKQILSLLALLALGIVSATPVRGQTPDPLARDASGLLTNPYLFYTHALNDRNDYISPLIEFEGHEKEYLGSDKSKFLIKDLLAYLNAYVGRYDRAIAYQDSGWAEERSQPDLTSSKLDEYKPLSALKEIGKAAEGRKVVMINEEHVTPQHRAFTRDLLPIMWAKGFRYFAAETFGTNFKDPKYPAQTTGFYSDDPVFGDMIRVALKLGFKLIPYESFTPCNPIESKPNHCQNEREREQAQNLYDRTLKIDPSAKVFVHVGRGHNQKIKMEDWAMMGWHFKEISGVDPLSIDQMHSERSARRFERPIYRYADAKWKIKEPTVLIDPKGSYWGGYGQDIVIFHPRTVRRLGRPTWLFTKEKRAIAIADKLPAIRQAAVSWPFLIQAFVESEGEDAIPMDQVIMQDAKDSPVLILSKGGYRIRALDAGGRVIFTGSVRR